MSLNTFIHDLQHDPDRVRPEDWEADWADAPRLTSCTAACRPFPSSRKSR
ncbi:hypothetical protein LJK88_49110 [Paenibacillus sp. P26]|nr:hypothetical protein LJK88_49110 [Paenibacillus sp. P26]